MSRDFLTIFLFESSKFACLGSQRRGKISRNRFSLRIYSMAQVQVLTKKVVQNLVTLFFLAVGGGGGGGGGVASSN